MRLEQTGAKPLPVLLSLQVKSLFLLLHPDLDAELHKLSSNDDLLNFWAKTFQTRPFWTDILKGARACDYVAVGKGLSVVFE